MDISEGIKKALPLYADSQIKSEEDLESAIRNAGVPVALARKILEFVPLAFGRIFLKEMNVQLRADFVRHNIENGRIVEKQRRPLANEPVFREAFRIGSEMATNQETSQLFLKVAFWGAEMQAVNTMELKGAKPENLVLTEPSLQWRDENEFDEQLPEENNKILESKAAW